MTDIEFKEGDEVTYRLTKENARDMKVFGNFTCHPDQMIRHVPAPEPRKFVVQVWKYKTDGAYCALIGDNNHLAPNYDLIATATITEGEGL